jgi:tRNA modification GTPase
LAVIAGQPNAGKSSLFNFLLKEDRSIVTEAPGTTRDWIEAMISVEGIPVRLADTAGLRELPAAGGPAAEAERLGIERSRELLTEADLILYVIDGAGGTSGEDNKFLSEFENNKDKKAPVLVLRNKADLSPPPPEAGGVLRVSAKTGEGVPALLEAMAAKLEEASGAPDGTPDGAPGGQPGDGGTGPGTLRQKELITGALAAVEEALALAARGEALDLIAPLLREGVNCLGEITGEVSTSDLLETMFSQFCVGK